MYTIKLFVLLWKIYKIIIIALFIHHFGMAQDGVINTNQLNCTTANIRFYRSALTGRRDEDKRFLSVHAKSVSINSGGTFGDRFNRHMFSLSGTVWNPIKCVIGVLPIGRNKRHRPLNHPCLVLTCWSFHGLVSRAWKSTHNSYEKTVCCMLSAYDGRKWSSFKSHAIAYHY